MRFAVLGLGSAGARHGRLLVELGHQVIGFDPGASASNSQVPLAASEEEAMESADAVLVASPSAMHATQALKALEQGTPVLVEKPLASTAEDAEQIESAAARAGLPCAVAMNLRFHPGITALRELVTSGELGEVRLAHVWYGHDLRRWRPQTDYRDQYSARAELGGGIVLDATHELDYLMWLCGPVQEVTALAGRVSDLEIDVEDVAVAALRFRSGGLGAIDVNFFELVYRRGCVLVGSAATAAWDWNADEVTVGAGESKRVLDVSCDLEDTYRAELMDFVRVIGEGGTPRAPVEDGVASVRLAEAIKLSAREGRRVSLGGVEQG